MPELKDRWLWVGFVASVLLGVLLHTLQLSASGDPLWQAVQVFLDVGFWFSMTSAVVLAVIALRIGVLVPPGSRRRATPALLVGLAAVLGLAFVVGFGTSNWLIFASPGSAAPFGYASLILDAFVRLIEVSAGSLIALATLTLMTSHDRPTVRDHKLPPAGTQEGASRSE